MPVAKIDEQRRQEEADRASRGYALPMDTDGRRFAEPVTDRFAPEIADDIARQPEDGDGTDADSRRERRVSVQHLDAVSRCKGRVRSGFDDAGVPAEGSETDAILEAVS